MTNVFDEQGILSDTPLHSIFCFDSLASTNDTAKSLTNVDLPSLVIARQQTAGRGQQSNRWWSDRGSITASWIFGFGEELPPGLFALAAGVAVADAIDSIDEKLAPKTKWPNDIILNGAKVAGILVETQIESGFRIITGIGINANCEIADAPKDISERATSLKCALGCKIDPQSLIISLTNAIDNALRSLKIDPQRILTQFQAKSIIKTGSELSLVTRDGNTHRGKFADLVRMVNCC